MAASKQLEGILGKVTTATPAAKAVTPLQAAPKPAPVTAEVVQIPATELTESKPRKAPGKKPEPQKSVQAFVPASIDKALRMKAAEEGTTTRTIILRGLKAIGFDVPDDELRDKRSKA
ncbi:hypothetical protein FHT70_005992 [Rhizobium sp. BK049]|uniref:hypothetical protein n=1 Tax=Rhizobium sp. BK049 TaxID=2587095 RepID=UPI00161B42D9|nr:hypothetical protein [Rhizobium sp. BK049]MBB3356019.1 hypothetical protein [Rhizobium sp. BK049]